MRTLTCRGETLRDSCVLVRDGRIAYSGPRAEAPSAPGSVTHKLNGQWLLPGFNDCHMHILPYGLDLRTADLSPDAGVTSVETMVVALRKWRAENPDALWIRGSRYDQNTFPGAWHPTCHDLDAAYPNEPVYVVQTSKHAAVANSAALRLAGIDSSTEDPPGGEIVRDSDGEPVGLLLENAMGLMSSALPAPTRAEMAAAIRAAHARLAANGITSASDMNTGCYSLADEIAAYGAVAACGGAIRTTLFPHAPCFGGPEDLPVRAEMREAVENAGGKPSGVRLGAMKLFADGALTVRTAALREPYVDGSGMGMLLYHEQELQEYIGAAHLLGWQVAVHAIGDAAIEAVLDAYDLAQEGSECADRRHRIEHAMVLPQDLLRRIAYERIVPVVQPEFLSRLGDAYVLGLGHERASGINPTATLQSLRVGVPFSSDCPIVPGAPLDGIRAACLRTTRSGAVLGPDERISAFDGLQNYTHWAAYSSFDEMEVGSLTLGMRADICIVDSAGEDWTIDHLEGARVLATMSGGEWVHGADAVAG